MTERRTIVDDASITNLHELEGRARAAAHANFAQWHKQEKAQRPRRIVMVLLMLTNRGA
jgi:hypothetical protein